MNSDYTLMEAQSSEIQLRHNTTVSDMINNIISSDLDMIVEQDLDWSQFDNKTVLISGANGFVPSYMVETLLGLKERRGITTKVVALVRDKKKAVNKFAHHSNNSSLEFLVQDVCEPIDGGNLGPVDFIVHAASLASPKFFASNPIGTLNPNVQGTINLLQLGKEKSINAFLFFSSGEVYGETSSNQIPTKETDFGYIDPMNVRSCYGESKRMGETICVSWQNQHGVPVKIVRPFHTYGPGMDLNDGRVFADFVADILSDRDIIMKSEGTNTRAFCYLADATLGFFTVLLKGKTGQAYNVGFNRETSILELAETLVSLFPEKKLRVAKVTGSETNSLMNNAIQRTCPDISKISALGWHPVTSIEEGFKRTIESYQI